MRHFLIICMLLFLTRGASAQQNVLNIPGIHQLVGQSINENKLQKKARDKQAIVAANEQANLTMLDKLKKTYRIIQERYNTLGTAINAAEIGIFASPMVSRIISNQAQIIKLAGQNPALIAIGYNAELRFVQKAQSLIRYVTALTLSYGDINQMKPSDRKILFDFVLSELSVVQELSGSMLALLRYATLKDVIRDANPFQNFIDADRELAGDIIRNAKYLKR